jgi:hypothetical protein
MTMAISQTLSTYEKTEAGDIARSLEGLIKSQFINRDFWSLITSTRLSRLEVEEFSNLNYIGVMSRVNRITQADIDSEDFKSLDEYLQKQLKEALLLKKAMNRNPWVIHEVNAFSWMYMYSAGMQSLDGGSRFEGKEMVTGTTGRLMDKDKMGFWDKLGRRFSGRGLEYSE